jgi:hypothetical protein
MLDASAERTLTEVTAQLRAICGQRLVTVALYGSAAGVDYVPGRSDLNLVVVLDEIDGVLLAIRSHIPRWANGHVATPLLLDRHFLSAAADVFPMELYDIQERHRILHGADVFAALDLSGRYLHYQCEHEARGKLLRLRELYLEVGRSRRALQELLLDSLTTFLIVIRTVTRLRGLPAAASYAESLRVFCRDFGCSLPAMERAMRIRRGEERWSGDPEEIFREYAGEIGLIVGIVDQLYGDASGHGRG